MTCVKLTYSLAAVSATTPASRPSRAHRGQEAAGIVTFDGSRLVMSDGSATLQFRDPRTFALLSTVDVRLEGRPVHRLNELEYARGLVWANVWQTDRIVAIDPATGNVVKVVDARGLLDRAERFRADVLNGIAYDSRRGAFYVTGKRWPWLFEVRFVPEEKNP